MSPALLYTCSESYRCYLNDGIRPNAELPPLDFNQAGLAMIVPGERYCRWRDARGLCAKGRKFSTPSVMRAHYKEVHKVSLLGRPVGSLNYEEDQQVLQWYTELVNGQMPSWPPANHGALSGNNSAGSAQASGGVVQQVADEHSSQLSDVLEQGHQSNHDQAETNEGVIEDEKDASKLHAELVPSLMAGNYVDIRATMDAIDRLLNERDERDESDESDESDQSYWLSENCRRGLVKVATRLGVSFIATVAHHQEIYNLSLNDVTFGPSVKAYRQLTATRMSQPQQGQASNLLRLGFSDPEFGKYNNACRRFTRDVDWCLKLSRLDERIRNLIIDDLPAKFVQVPQVNMSRARFEGEALEIQDE
ncbi:hypothetical protein ACHAPJ_012784 [Fusarium lateritium]